MNNQTAHRHSLLFLFLVFLLSACTPFSSPTPRPLIAPPELELEVDGLTPSPQPVTDRIAVYFTDPRAPGAQFYEGGPDEVLAAAIDSARLSVDVAVYNLTLWSVRDALLRAHRRGVVVRVVTESDNLDNAEIQDLIASGIPVVGDRREGLMHHKFVVIDRSQVWTGSLNLSVGGTYRDHNNLVHILSSEVAWDYTVEFEEMFVEDRFGDFSLADTPYPVVQVAGTDVEVYFSPDDGVATRIVELIGSAEASVYFLAFSFTSDEIGAALRERSLFIPVAGVMEEEQAATNEGTEYELLRQALVDVRLDGNPGLMHHKVIIIDERIVITGSYNFSRSAEERNDENVVVIFNADVAAQFLSEFWRVYGQAQP
ncbi:MAG: DUF1669 domain-containing protein [Anaerolineales bacterium]|nr:DUF1669 domain-containing protein [Anaerolineales bacterium]